MHSALMCAVNETCDSHIPKEACAYCMHLCICSVRCWLGYITAAAIRVGLWDAVLAAVDRSLCVSQGNALQDLQEVWEVHA